MKTRQNKATSGDTKTPLQSTSTNDLSESQTSINEQSSGNGIPCIESGIVGSNSEIVHILKMIVKLQETTLKVLSGIEEHILTDDSHSMVAAKLDELSVETKSIAVKFEQFSEKLVPDHLVVPSNPTNVTQHDTGITVNPAGNSLYSDEDNKELAAILLKEKKEKSLREQCIKIKRKIGLDWTQSLQNRKKFYNNFVKNYKKSKLYSHWIETAPDFIPLKFKPKRIPGELPNHTAAKINIAKQKYKDDVNLMLEYSRIHQARVRNIDQEISELITSSCISEEQVATLKDMWTDDCAELEHRAAQTWLRTERFLNKKKHDDEKRQ